MVAGHFAIPPPTSLPPPSTAPAIEARSLSSLTTLASNPPSYPRNPTHGQHDPLVLYIARVPGSRDVFLSPMKPRDKVVTAEDIQNSLYFVHVDHPEDTRLLGSAPSFQNPDYGDDRSVYSNHQQPAAVPRKAIPGAPVSAQAAAPPQRKPLPGTLAPINNFASKQNANIATHLPTPSTLLKPDYVPRRSFDSLQFQAEHERPALSPRRASEQPSSLGASLTLIRRDPVSGAQWNVARIEDPPVLDVSSSTVNESTTKKTIGAPMFIDVTNPGYSKFIHSELKTNAPPPRDENTRENSNVFRRRLWMEGSKYSSGGFGHQRFNSHDSNISGGSPRNSGEGWPRERSSIELPPTATPPFLSRQNQSYNTIQGSERQSTFRGYVFTSPWNGRCEFITGAGGGSLKCRHLVPGLQGAPPAPMPVSELRFNLPSSSRATTPRGEGSPKRSSIFHRPRHSRNSSSVSESRIHITEDVRGSLERMDLSLGQEFAGGGSGGKHSKLGKLIIEDEGLKMLDLLVATNIALWWRAYEKRDTRSKTDRGDRGSF